LEQRGAYHSKCHRHKGPEDVYDAGEIAAASKANAQELKRVYSASPTLALGSDMRCDFLSLVDGQGAVAVWRICHFALGLYLVSHV
jgi:hypothetical protein